MNQYPFARGALLGLPLAGALALAGCATPPAPKAAAPAAPPPPAAAQPTSTMKPIPDPERREAPRPAYHPPSAPPPAAAATPAKPPVAKAAPPPSADPARAAKLRAAGLEQLNRGAVDRAVALLSQAARLAPGNVLIQRDLDRALRISRAVHAKH